MSIFKSILNFRVMEVRDKRLRSNLLKNIYMLFAGWEVRIVKNCDRGLENAARGRRPRAAFSSRGHSFSLYGPTLSRQITYLFFSCDKIGLQV